MSPLNRCLGRMSFQKEKPLGMGPWVIPAGRDPGASLKNPVPFRVHRPQSGILRSLQFDRFYCQSKMPCVDAVEKKISIQVNLLDFPTSNRVKEHLERRKGDENKNHTLDHGNRTGLCDEFSRLGRWELSSPGQPDGRENRWKTIPPRTPSSSIWKTSCLPSEVG